MVPPDDSGINSTGIPYPFRAYNNSRDVPTWNRIRLFVSRIIAVEYNDRRNRKKGVSGVQICNATVRSNGRIASICILARREISIIALNESKLASRYHTIITKPFRWVSGLAIKTKYNSILITSVLSSLIDSVPGKQQHTRRPERSRNGRYWYKPLRKLEISFFVKWVVNWIGWNNAVVPK